MTDGPPSWAVQRHLGEASDLLQGLRSVPVDDGCAIAVNRVTGHPALVLGSTQMRHLDDRVHGTRIALARRATGGGCVLVAPGAQVWIDFWVDRSSPKWSDDVVSAATWVGDVWAQALASLGVPSQLMTVHRERLLSRDWSDVFCFAGIGPGEVCIGRSKVVGVAQRRTSGGAWFQSVAPMYWEPRALFDAFEEIGVTLERSSKAERELVPLATGLRRAVGAGSSSLSDEALITEVEAAVVDAASGTIA